MTDSTSIALPLFTKFGRFATTFRLEFTTTKEQSRILFLSHQQLQLCGDCLLITVTC